MNVDIIILGGGISGLWLLHTLRSKGFSVLLLEREALGGTQTMASQGMIHGGQRYMLGVKNSVHAERVAQLPYRWDACFAGRGEIDLSTVRILSPTQVMWSTGGHLARFALIGAAHTLTAKMRKLNDFEAPSALAHARCFPIYELPEKVIDTASLVKSLSASHRNQIGKGCVEQLSPDGSIIVSGHTIRAQLVVCAAGVGNEVFLSLLGAGKSRSQRRPLRQFMVKPMPFPLYGHGIGTGYKPRITVTSFPLSSGGYIWYIGGALADSTLALSEDNAIAFAKREMSLLFSHLDWTSKAWATWFGVRAEPADPSGRLPDGPVVQEYGKVLVVWPTKLTLVPTLSDMVLACIKRRDVRPSYHGSSLPELDLAYPPSALLPWEQEKWFS